MPSTHTATTKDAVFAAATELLDKNGKTTTLEVRDHLRAKMFWTEQRDISRWMKELASENEWDSDFNGTFNTFSRQNTSDDTTVTATATTVAAPVQDTPTVTPAKKSDPDTEAKIKDVLFNTFHIYRGVVKPSSKLKTDLGLSDGDINTLNTTLSTVFGLPGIDAGKCADVAALAASIDQIKSTFTK